MGKFIFPCSEVNRTHGEHTKDRELIIAGIQVSDFLNILAAVLWNNCKPTRKKLQNTTYLSFPQWLYRFFLCALQFVPTLYLIIKRNVILSIASSIAVFDWNSTEWQLCPECGFNKLARLDAIRAISTGMQSSVAILFEVLLKLMLHLANATICIQPHQWQHKIAKYHFIGIKCFGCGIILWSCLIVVLYYYHLNISNCSSKYPRHIIEMKVVGLPTLWWNSSCLYGITWSILLYKDGLLIRI